MLGTVGTTFQRFIYKNNLYIWKKKTNEYHCLINIGIGYAVVLIAFYVDFYYNVIIAWSLRFFFASFTSNLPWTSCHNEWNTPSCKPVILIIKFN